MLNKRDYKNYIRIGINHHLLYHKYADTPTGHQKTLYELIKDKRFDVIDLWIREEEPFRSEEIKALKDSEKEIYYNVGTRKGKEPAHPASLNKKKFNYSLDFYKRELDRGLEAGCSKVIMNSGPDVPDNRKDAMNILFEFCCEICDYVGENIKIMIEPTDRETDKCKLIGPSQEAVLLAKRINNTGRHNFSSMVDMCHLPLLGESINHAMRVTNKYLGHIHLGNCIIANTNHPLYGDKHPPWGIEGGGYEVKDIANVFLVGIEMEYFNKEKKGSASFEMRPLPPYNEKQSVDYFFQVLDKAWDIARGRSL
jgi:hypothetical protein